MTSPHLFRCFALQMTTATCETPVPLLPPWLSYLPRHQEINYEWCLSTSKITPRTRTVILLCNPICTDKKSGCVNLPPAA